MPSDTLTVRFLRGGWSEAEHPVHAVLVDADGTVLRRVGAPCVTTWRSGAKPFQLTASLAHWPAHLAAPLTAEDLALGAASHSAEPHHVARVTALLARAGLDVSALRCGPHPPMHKASELGLARRAEAVTALHNNCSGKHTFMAVATHSHGWDADYRAPTHPLQQRIRAVVDDFAGGLVQDTVIDGCGVPCFVLPLEGMARAYATLARRSRDGDDLLGRIGRAMAAHPALVSGEGRSDLALVRHAHEPLVSKVGAEGLLCVAAPARGVALALKIASGHEEARMAAARALLTAWMPGAVDDAAFVPFVVMRNAAGDVVGERRADFD